MEAEDNFVSVPEDQDMSDNDDNATNPLNTWEYKCPHCPEKFDKSEPRRKHVLKEHKDTKPCNECDQVFKTMREYNQHKYKEHRFVQCKLCDNKYLRHIYKRHMQLVHGDRTDLKYQCTECSYKTYADLRLKEHYKSHHLKTDMQCSNCSKYFTVHKYYNLHIKKCALKRTKPLVQKKTKGIRAPGQLRFMKCSYSCQECNETFIKSLDYIGHFHEKHDTLPPELCDFR